MERWEQRQTSFHKALSRLAEIVSDGKRRRLNDFEHDGLVQRFEFTHESVWKLMKIRFKDGLAVQPGHGKVVLKTMAGKFGLSDLNLRELHAIPYFFDTNDYNRLTNPDLIDSIDREGRVLYKRQKQ